MMQEKHEITSSIDKLPRIEAVHFTALKGPCYRLEHGGLQALPARYLLPSTQALTGEKTIAKIFLGWHEEGLAITAEVRRPTTHVAFPDIRKGDSLELFFDTRDIKTSGYNTKFCHHFFFLPREIEGKQKGEKTHFRTEDCHDLCPPQSLQLDVKETQRSHKYSIFIPKAALQGYEPLQSERLGFSYRISAFGTPGQHFAALSSVYPIEEQPSLWASLSLEKD